MAALQFQSQDKENVEGYFNISRTKGNRQALGSKSILQNRGVKSMQNVNGPSFVTPRKTLGDIQNNQTPHTGLSLKPGQTLKPVSMKPTLNLQKTATKQRKNVSFKASHPKEKESIKKTVLAPVSMNIDVKERNKECDDIEYMNKPEEDKDDRYPPQEERVSNYLNKLISWRPPCLFGIPPLSDEEDEEEEERQRNDQRNKMFDDLDTLAGIDPFDDLPQLDEDDMISPEPLEVHIPYIDETLPTLEDSYSCSLSPNLGVLQLNDSVLM